MVLEAATGLKRSRVSGASWKTGVKAHDKKGYQRLIKQQEVRGLK